MENGWCVGDMHIVVEPCLVLLCILHCCIGPGRLQVAFIEALLGDLAKDNATDVQPVLYRARRGARVGSLAAHGKEEASALFLAWEEIGPLLAYAPEDGEWEDVVAMRDLLVDLYSDTPPRDDLRAAEIVRAYYLHCSRAPCQSNCLLYLEEDVILALANAAALGLGLGALCANVAESLNAFLKRAYLGGGGGGITTGGRGGLAGWGVVFLKF